MKKEKETARDIRLGAFVVAGLLLLVTGLYFIGSNKNMFGKTFTLYAGFRNVGGLQTGNNVRFAGIDVGTIDKIEIVNDTVIRVKMNVNIDLKKVIRKNSRASIGTDGLMGNKLVNIDPGTEQSAEVSEGDQLASMQTVNTEEMLRTLELTNQNIAVVSANLKNITENIYKSHGTLYTVLMDSTIGSGFKRTISNIEGVSTDLTSITGDLSGVTSNVQQGKGLLGTLLKDTVMSAELAQAISDMKKSSEQISATAGELNRSFQKINGGNGTIGTLMNDSITAQHLKSSIVALDSSALKFNENMEALKHTWPLRGYFRKQAKKKN